MSGADTIGHTEKIPSGQTFTDILNLHLEHSNLIFPQDAPAYDAVLSTKSGCKPTSSLEDTTETVIFDYISLHCDLDIEHSEPIFLHDTLAYDAA